MTMRDVSVGERPGERAEEHSVIAFENGVRTRPLRAGDTMRFAPSSALAGTMTIGRLAPPGCPADTFDVERELARILDGPAH